MKSEKLHTEFFGKEYYKNLCKNLRLPEDFVELDAFDYMFIYYKLIHRLYGNSVAEEKLNKLTDEIDSFLIESYKEFFGKEYKEGDTIPEDKQKEWTDFIYNKINN